MSWLLWNGYRTQDFHSALTHCTGYELGMSNEQWRMHDLVGPRSLLSPNAFPLFPTIFFPSQASGALSQERMYNTRNILMRMQFGSVQVHFGDVLADLQPCKFVNKIETLTLHHC